MKKTTKDLEKEFGINRKTLFFYEEEGLLHPERKENGYRVYQEKDCENLKEILLLRKLDVSLADIKAYLRNEMSWQQLLEKQSDALHEKKEQYEEKERKVQYIKSREMPLLDYGDLLDVNKAVGRRISLCKRKRKKGFVKALGIVFLLAVVIGFFFLSDYKTSLMNFMPIYLYLVPLFIIVAAFFFHVIHQEAFLEFADNGVFFYRGGNTRDDLKHCWAVIGGNEEDGICFVPYEKIETVHIRVKTDYCRMGAVNLPWLMYTYSISFTFQEEKGFALSFPYTMDKDQGLFAFVLLSKVKNIDDPHGALEAMAKGQSLTAHMKMQNA